MKGSGVNVELSRHARLDEALRVLDILVHKKVECADRNVSGRQICQIPCPRRCRVGRYVRPAPVAAQVGFPAQAVAFAIPPARVGNRLACGGNVAIIDHGVDEKLESDLHFATVAGHQRQPCGQAASAAGAANRDARRLNTKLAGMGKQPL